MAADAVQKREILSQAARAFALCAALLFSGAAAAQIHKCQNTTAPDACRRADGAATRIHKCQTVDGRVAYSDAPCGEVAQQADVQVHENVIETGADAQRVRRSLTQLEKEAAAAERQRLKEEQKRAAAPKAARASRAAKAAKAAPKEPEQHGTPEHQRRLRAQQRRSKAQQRAQQQRVTPYRQR